MRELGEALADNSTLTALHLGDCGITAAGEGKSACLMTLNLALIFFFAIDLKHNYPIIIRVERGQGGGY